MLKVVAVIIMLRCVKKKLCRYWSEIGNTLIRWELWWIIPLVFLHNDKILCHSETSIKAPLWWYLSKNIQECQGFIYNVLVLQT